MGSNTGGHAYSMQEGGTLKVQGEEAIVGTPVKEEGNKYGKRGTLTHTGILRGAWEGNVCIREMVKKTWRGRRRKQIL
jgi:hypothetical protein